MILTVYSFRNNLILNISEYFLKGIISQINVIRSFPRKQLFTIEILKERGKMLYRAIKFDLFTSTFSSVDVR